MSNIYQLLYLQNLHKQKIIQLFKNSVDNGNKLLSTSGGGVIVTNDKKKADYMRFLSTQAKEPMPFYHHKEIGYNYRMSNVIAGIGRGQIKVLDDYVEKRRRNYDYYNHHLGVLDAITFIEEPETYYSNRWLTCILLDTKKMRDDLLKLLNDNNIEARPSWKPMHLQELYKDAPAYLNGVSKKLYECGLCLPSGSNLQEKDLERITKLILSYFE